MNREPVVVAFAAAGTAISGAVAALIVMVNAFHPGSITQEQQGAVLAFLAALWVALGAVALVVRQLVTPTASPSLPAGTDVKLPDGTPGTVVPK